MSSFFTDVDYERIVAALVDERDALIAQRDRAEADAKTRYERVMEIGEEYWALRAERDALAKDAARYRWIRGRDGCPFAETDDAWFDGGLDAAIDQAMEKAE